LLLHFVINRVLYVGDARGCVERTDFRWVAACSLAEQSIVS